MAKGVTASDRSTLSGLLVVDKPPGISSMRAVEIVRRKAGGVKAGHGGTLDPLAEGMLVVALGAATKQMDRMLGADKTYRTVIDLSAFTTTDDREGKRHEMRIDRPPDAATIEAVLRRFVGTIQQRPPAFSAMKVGGRRAYKLARRGEAPLMAPRPVVVHDVSLIRYEWPLLEIAIHCGKGFYVRSLARDIGEALGTGGHCATLRRTAVGSFTEAMAVGLDRLPDPLRQEDLIPVDRLQRQPGW